MKSAPAKEPAFGFVDWFRPGEYERTEQVLEGLVASGTTYLRTHLSWAEFHAAGGQDWYDWLLPKVGRDLQLLPCVHYTPPSLSRNGRTSGAPRRLQDYADFIDIVLTRYGEHFREVELWNEPNNLLDWDWRADTEYYAFCEMVGAAAHWARERGWRTVLGGPSPFDPYWLNLMGERGLLDVMDAVGLHGFPGTWESDEGSWSGWGPHIAEMREILDRYKPETEIWITEAGYSTWRNDEVEQVRHFLAALDAPADRLYWYSWRDVPHDVAVQEGFWFDPRHYHLGAVESSGRPKLLGRLLADGGIAKLRGLATVAAPALGQRTHPVAITGGAGFIGSNLADALLSDGHEVVVADALRRPGVEENLEWLIERHGTRVHPALVDIRDRHALAPALSDASAVFHLAAQTAVTTSLADPVDDFETNARGTLNVLEVVRALNRRVPVILSSTNKVYGALDDLAMIEMDDRYIPEDKALRAHGVDERRPLDFCTPYGCSKGVADQYVLDYAKSYRVPAAVLRMSCVYGPRQFGTEDQGWVAHFLISAMHGRRIDVFGNGKQVRDVLHVRDAVAAYRAVLDKIGSVNGRAFNLGGGTHNAVSLQMVLREIGRILGHEPHVAHGDWRAGDQLYFVADTRRLREATGWSPQVAWRDGIRDLAKWLEPRRRITREDARSLA
ncbi:NAD-dependent epimerase/dehydratase family protein [Roseitranquillus sediminis]|uniref:NAD-dependent epimerase/dehydratase family protein n=1 Tax=Roseitranquillus sediminis TaxID=2809051 RepID=UPI001D0C6F4F|nr:NAD-dependent epimerase/dehydratase family protein [Roseitranquillus sediminis]MBM9593375.1 NAD-dependent epimerase/dehydratase family protein [Roseitranquillus sediminis]